MSSVAPLAGTVADAIENIIASVPATRESASKHPGAAARALARKSATRAAALSGALALPPGVFGMMTVLPDLIAIWRIQSQMVADIAGLYGKEVELTRAHMVYCLFRHATSQLARDVAVRAGERLVFRQMSGGALKSVLSWLPVIGAVAVAGYAYYDTLQVAKTAIGVLETPGLTLPA
jgi:uncharacterized protein (DUF697 family)